MTSLGNVQLIELTYQHQAQHAQLKPGGNKVWTGQLMPRAGVHAWRVEGSRQGSAQLSNLLGGSKGAMQGVYGDSAVLSMQAAVSGSIMRRCMHAQPDALPNAHTQPAPSAL